MSVIGETFFTVVGCMDGRCQEAAAEFGRKKFGAKYADTITEPGVEGMLANNPSEEFLENLKNKLLISLEKHHSQGIIVDGHAECAGNPVDDKTHKAHIRNAVGSIMKLTQGKVPVVGVFVHRCPEDHTVWEVEEIT